MQVCTSCKKLLKAGALRCPDDGAAAQLVETLPVGTRLSAYRIERVLGEGGMGFVYEATHEVLNRRAAIKMLRPELANHAHIVTRFLNEAKAVNLINHEHIVNVYDYGDSDDGSVYFVMEYLEGETLDDLMHKRRPMPLPLLLHVFGQILRALAAAHAKQIVHRDLKPANVFVVARDDNPYFIKLLDFGIAQLRGAGAVQGLTIVGSVMGTPQYMSPEQVSGGVVDARSDVWAMGVMLYRAATGVPPFGGEEFAELADKILHHPPQPAGELRPMSAALSALIMSCLARDPAARCPSVAALIDGLEQVKREVALDDDAILDAVMADAHALTEGKPGPRGVATRGGLGASLPRYQDVKSRVPRGGQALAAPRSRLPLILGGAILLIGGGAYAVVRGGRGTPATTGVTSVTSVTKDTKLVEPAPAPTAPTVASVFRERGPDAARPLAEAELHKAITGSSLQHAGFAIDALARTRTRAGVPLLYDALKLDDNQARVLAARALCGLGLPDAAPKVRSALGGAGELPKTDLAAALLCLGDADAKQILVRALDKPGSRQAAAAALAQAGDAAGRAVLADVVATIPAGRDQWRAATAALAKLGDAKAHQALAAELSQADPARALKAADLLAQTGDAAARDLLARDAADADFARRGDAAIALARLGDARALAWIDAGLASSDADERTQAIAIVALLPGATPSQRAAIAELATHDPDLAVRLTADAALLSQPGTSTAPAPQERR